MKMGNWLITIFWLFLISSNGPSGHTQNRKLQGIESKKVYKVIGVKDGDTFVLFMNGKEQVVRLAHVDCPEKKQPFGNNAKQFTSDACFGKQIRLIHNNNYDRNKRLIAEVILKDGRNFNKELVKNGLAWHFKRYSQNESYAILEATARKKRIGLWADKDPVTPWNWRRK